MSLGDNKSHETTNMLAFQNDNDINHAIGYELKHVRASKNLAQNLKSGDTQRTSTNTMLFDQNLMAGVRPIDSFEPSFNVSGSMYITE